MARSLSEIGNRFGVAAFGFALGYDVVQILQVIGVLRFPFDEILIYSTSLGIVAPFLLAVLAFDHLTPRDKQFWSHAALLFAVIYAIFVTANHVVQLATVVPAKMRGEAPGFLEQTPPLAVLGLRRNRLHRDGYDDTHGSPGPGQCRR